MASYARFTVIGVIAFVAGVGAGFVLHDSSNPSSPSPSDVRVVCQADGRDLVTVPDLVGKRLPAAAAGARAGGLQLVGTGVSGGDPTGASATVVAQAPPGGSRVPTGACIGFRTRS